MLIDYFESAEDITISFDRALQEYRDHHVINPTQEMVNDLGLHSEYKAQAVLIALGY